MREEMGLLAQENLVTICAFIGNCHWWLWVWLPGRHSMGRQQQAQSQNGEPNIVLHLRSRLRRTQQQPGTCRKKGKLPHGVYHVLDDCSLHHFSSLPSAAASRFATRASSSAVICCVSTIAMSSASPEPPNMRFTRSLNALPVARSRLTAGR